MGRKTLAIVALALSAACARRETPPPAAQASAAAKPFEIDSKTPIKDPLPMVAARVNGHDVPTAQVVVVAEGALRDGTVKDKILAYRQTLNQLVVRELLLQEALRRGVAADSAAVDRAYDEARVAYKEDADWIGELKRQGFTPQGFREELRAKQTVNLLLSQEAQKVEDAEPSEAELREFYDSNAPQLAVERLKVAHILVRVPQSASPQFRLVRWGRADDARKRALASEDFAAVVKQYSEDPATRERGGVLPPFGRGETIKTLADAAFALQPGEISKVVDTPLGFHVLKLLERIPAKTPPFEEIKDRLRQQLAQARRQQHVQSLVDGLRARARIETFL